MVGMMGGCCCSGGRPPPSYDPGCGCFAGSQTNRPVIYSNQSDSFYSFDGTKWKAVFDTVPPRGWPGDYFDGSRRLIDKDWQYIRTPEFWQTQFGPADGAVRYAVISPPFSSGSDYSATIPHFNQFFNYDFTYWDWEWSETFTLDLSVCPDYAFGNRLHATTPYGEIFSKSTGHSAVNAGLLIRVRTNAQVPNVFFPPQPIPANSWFAELYIGPTATTVQMAGGTHTLRVTSEIQTPLVYPQNKPITVTYYLDDVQVASYIANGLGGWVASGCQIRTQPWYRVCNAHNWSASNPGKLVNPNNVMFPANWVGRPRDLFKENEWSITANER